MAQRESDVPETEAVNIRLKRSTKLALKAYRTRWRFHPTMTAIIEEALADWFARNPLPPDDDKAKVKLPEPKRR